MFHRGVIFDQFAFFSFASFQVLDSYMDLLQKNQFNLEDKSKLRFALSALVRCLSLLPSNEREVQSSGQVIFFVVLI